jgi:hypothetical protein
MQHREQLLEAYGLNAAVSISVLGTRRGEWRVDLGFQRQWFDWASPPARLTGMTGNGAR